MSSTADRLAHLRREMDRLGIAGYIIDGGDPHQSEYPPPSWRSREWISGFAGSAGTVVVTKQRAGLWTDSRYYLEAAEVLEGTGIELMRDGEAETPAMEEWLGSFLPKGASVGYSTATTSISRAEALTDALGKSGLNATPMQDIVSYLGGKASTPAPSDAWTIPRDIAGEGREERIRKLQGWMTDQDVDQLVIATLDDIAWLLNIRAWDIPYNPLLLSYLLVSRHDIRLFAQLAAATQPQRLIIRELETGGVCTEEYENFYNSLEALPADARIAGDPDLVPLEVKNRLPEGMRSIQQPTRLWKARKNPREVEGMAECAIRDGIALLRFFRWLEDSIERRLTITEADCGEALVDFKAKDSDYLGESFEAICGAGPHGAIVHYRVSPESNQALEAGMLFLLDQGSHYRFGTSDATRVEPVCAPGGAPTEAQRQDYTAVLRSHIALATARFPEGTKGEQLDTVARDALWRSGRSYGHGTGHGVGFLTMVHEGPCRISPKPSGVALEPGMVLSNEPGIYRPGQYGIRLENLVTVVPDGQYENFLAFRTFGMAPLHPSLIDLTVLSEDERSWLHRYNAAVLESLEPRLTAPERSWLEGRCVPR